MMDGIIKADGTSRLMRATLPATYEEFKAQAAAGTLPLDILFNEAGWSQLPTFLNKANLLKDLTANLFGLGADAVPDDVFGAVHDKCVEKIGDIKVTARTDLGDNWYLCNGTAINPLEHPEWLGILKDFKGSNGGTFQQITKVFEKYNNFGFASAPYIRGVCRLNGYTFYGISETGGTNNTRFFSVSPDDVVTEHILPTDGNSCYPVEGVYKDGKYILRCFASYTSTAWSRVFVFDDVDGGEPRYSWMTSNSYNVSANMGGLEIDVATGKVYLFGVDGSTIRCNLIDLENKTAVEVHYTRHSNSFSFWCRPTVYNGQMYAWMREPSNVGFVYKYSLSGDNGQTVIGNGVIPANSSPTNSFALIHKENLYVDIGNGNCWRYSLETGEAETFAVSTSISNGPITCVDENGFFTGLRQNGYIHAYRWDFVDGKIESKGSFSGSDNSEYPSVNRSGNVSATKFTVDENGFFGIEFTGATATGKHIQMYQTIKLPKLSLDGAYAYIKLEEDNV